MIPLAVPARRVVMRAGLMRFLRLIAAPLGLTPRDARDLAKSVLTDTAAENSQSDDGGFARRQ
jgi:hypothetical protein